MTDNDQPQNQDESHAQIERQRVLANAKNGDQEAIGEILRDYRNYLNVLAMSQFDRRLKQRAGASDIVQETMMKAFQGFREFRGTSEPELRAWLRQILVNNLASLAEKNLKAARRDVRSETTPQKIGQSLEESSVRLERLLPARIETPSVIVQHREDVMTLSDRLAGLPDDHREVLVLRHLQGLDFQSIAEQMDRSVPAARMLWLRAIESLRKKYAADNPSNF